MTVLFLANFFHITRHISFEKNFEKEFQKLSLTALWGAGRKMEIALQLLEQASNNGCVGWPNIRCKVSTAKIQNVMSTWLSGDELAKERIIKAIQKIERQLKT